MENYEELYKKALKRARIGLHDCNLLDCDDMARRAAITTIYNLFPELAESEEERIRKAILELVKQSSEILGKQNQNNMIAWLEKQGEKNNTRKREIDDAYLQGMCDAKHAIEKQSEPTDKVEPKFHEGDWIISNNKKSIYQVIEVKRGIYVIRDNVDNHEYHIGIEECEKSGRLFTINDAKDGDVLASGQVVFIFKVIRDGWLYCHCLYHNDGSLIAESYDMMTYKYFSEVHPATKEQRDLLFQKMKNAGYEWNAEKKELKKIEHKKLDPDKVIAWLVANICDFEYYVEQFKKDFSL